MRRLVRERVLQTLYAYEMNREGLQALIDSTLNDITTDEDKNFASRLVHKVIAYQPEFDDLIIQKVANWEFERITLIDKVLMRMALCELIYFEDIPPKVSINESIEIAKEYSSAGSGKFINGILDSILNDLKASGKLKKTGIGLLEESLPKKKKK